MKDTGSFIRRPFTCAEGAGGNSGAHLGMWGGAVSYASLPSRLFSILA